MNAVISSLRPAIITSHVALEMRIHDGCWLHALPVETVLLEKDLSLGGAQCVLYQDNEEKSQCGSKIAKKLSSFILQWQFHWEGTYQHLVP